MESNFYNTVIADPSQEEESEEYRRTRRLRSAKLLISCILAFMGLSLLLSQIGPLALSYVDGMLLEQQINSIKDPTPAQELNPSTADLPYYDPGISYFQNLIEHIGSGSVAGATADGTYPGTACTPIIDKSYQSPMTINIPAIGISNIKITPNVDSLNENVYNAALKNGVAHFRGTPLPGSGCGNSFIYGHSAVDSFFSNHPNTPETIFSRLENIEIADTITVKKDGTMLTYVVQKKKLAEPDDFAVITGTENKETVTLMTCWPLGIGSKRLVVIAERTDG